MKCEYCGIEDTQTRIIESKYGTLCRKHYLQMYKHGKISRTIYDRNEIIFCEDHAELVLRDKEQNIVGNVLLDIEDVDRISKYKWHIKRSRNTNYAVYNEHGRTVFIHQIILDYYGDNDIDHEDHNGLNNCKGNLRIVSHALNLVNQHNEDNGVQQTPSGKYQARISIDGKTIYLGTFDTFQEAKQKRTEYEATLF